MDAVGERTTTQAEETPGVVAAHKVWTDYTKKLGKAYVSKKQSAKQNRKPKSVNIDGEKICVAKDVKLPADVGPFNASLRFLKLHRVYNRLEASVFLVCNVNEPGQRIQWCASLGGGVLCDLKYVMSKGHNGQTLGFKRATITKRTLWASPNFIAAHPEVHRILQAKSREAPGKFTWIANKYQFAALSVRRAASGNRTECVALVTAAEQRDMDRWGPNFTQAHALCPQASEGLRVLGFCGRGNEKSPAPGKH